MSKYRTFIFEEIEPCVGLVTLNRPDKLNAINVEMLDDFIELFAALTKDDAIRVLIITGAGRGFCAGADLNEALTHKDSEAISDPEHTSDLPRSVTPPLSWAFGGFHSP